MGSICSKRETQKIHKNNSIIVNGSIVPEVKSEYKQNENISWNNIIITNIGDYPKINNDFEWSVDLTNKNYTGSDRQLFISKLFNVKYPTNIDEFSLKVTEINLSELESQKKYSISFYNHKCYMLRTDID